MTLIRSEGSGDADLGFYSGVTSKSAIFNDGNSDHLTFTPTSASSAADRRKITHSVWIKRGTIGSAAQTIYSSTQNGVSDYYQYRFNADDTITLILDVNDSNWGYDTTAKYRDVSSWYHFCLIIDTTQGTDTDRVKLYVNGTLQTLSTKYSGGHVGQNFETYVMDGTEDAIGEFNYNSTQYFDGYMCDFITTVGQDTAIGDFGELKEGVWIPKEYSGSYGANGFRLEFKQTGTGTAGDSTVGADTANNNDWTSSGHPKGNILDNPENNFCTLNPLNANDHRGEATISEGNLRIESTSGNRGFTTGTMKIHGKVYFEVLSKDGNNGFVGIADIENALNGTNGQSIDMYNGTPRTDGSYHSDTGTYDDGDIVGVAVDVDAKSIEFFNNNSSVYSDNYTTAAEYFPFIHDSSGGRSMDAIANFGQDSSFAGETTAQGNTDGNGKGDFYYAPPSGYLALCSANLSEPLIGPNSDTNCDDHFVAKTYTGNNSARDIVLGLVPDLLWFKNRENTYNHVLYDSTRGATKRLEIPQTTAEATVAGAVTDFTASGGGFSVASDAATNENNIGIVVYGWKLNGGTTSSYEPTGASAAVTMQRNTTAGISMIRYIGTGTNVDTNDQELGHGVQVDGTDTKPDMMIFKAQTEYASGSWAVWHKDMTGNLDTDYLLLNSTAGTASTSDNIWGGTSGTYGEPTTTLAYIGFDWNVNKGPNALGTGNTAGYYMGYFFASVEGFSKFGQYTGNGNADGAYVYTGFRPAFVMCRDVTEAAGWHMFDSARSTYNPITVRIEADNYDAENTTSGLSIDFLSNGFKLTGNFDNINDDGNEHIYMAFAEQPFKYANAR